MTSHETSVQLEDLASTGTRVRWGPILAGATLALALYSLLTILGTAVGLSVTDRVNSDTLTTGAIIWTFIITCVSIFVGGLVTSLLTVGENKVEAVLHGAIMWGVLFVALLGLGAIGIRGGFNAMAGMTDTVTPTATNREAAVAVGPADASGRVQPGAANEVQNAQNQPRRTESATRVAWYAFAGMWLSMLAAALGAFVGAGPTFRIISLQPGSRLTTNHITDGRRSPDRGDGARGLASSTTP